MRDVHDLRGVDLDLLVALDVLLQARSVTRAAGELGLTQPAMSHALRRLRDLLGDPVLVRVGNAMEPTPRAEALVVPLRAALLDLGRALERRAAFDPATARRTFRLCSPDLFDALLLPDLVVRLTRGGPGVDLAVVPLPDRVGDALATGALDLAIGPVVHGATTEPSRTDLVRQTLFHDFLTCFVRRGHPRLADGALPLDAYLDLPHVMVSPTGSGPGPVDAALAPRGLTRRIALRLPSFAVAARVLADTDLVLTAPSSFARVVDADRVVPAPVPIEVPGHGVAMTWHARFQADAAHRWLREQVRAVAPP